VVVEAWPLLETLLRRSLLAAVGLAREAGQDWAADEPKTYPLLSVPPHPTVLRPGTPRAVRPDGVLREGTQVVATFEAKYSPGPEPGKRWPNRKDLFQTLATASALSAPVAVLVYPGRFETTWWQVAGVGPPRRLAAVGLDLYSYRRGTGELGRAARLRHLLEDATQADLTEASLLLP
jgi:hypothetical protein